MASITLEDLHAYHAFDRVIFSRLVLKLARDPAESLLVMATWLWLEELNFPTSIIEMMVSLSDLLVWALAEEIILGLRCLASADPPMLPNGGMPLTARVMEKDISLQMFYQNRFTAISGIKNFLNTVCSRIFTDILQAILGSPSQVNLGQPLVIPGFPHPLFGSINIVPRAMDSSSLPGGLWGWHPLSNVSADDRTMFLTFSRGFPVSEEEVRELFTRKYGDCVERVYMQLNGPNAPQPLFAKLVFRSIETVDKVLNGDHIAKFRMNGKHIWARKYERRD